MKNNIAVGIYTLGCRVNMYESCAIAERLRESGCTVTKNEKCDYYIVNTCAVTAESERKSRQLIRRCASLGKVLVIGCAAQLDNNYEEYPNVIYVGGNRNKGIVTDIITGKCDALGKYTASMQNADYEEMYICGKDDIFSECRAFIKIQDGCNGKCTYCIIPKCRGNVRSRDADAIVSEAERLVENGYSEIILTGIEVGAYNKIPLYELIERVSSVRGIKRLRLGSLSPNIITRAFLERVSRLKNFMPHIHLSLQSCNDNVLMNMKRPYRRSDIIKKVELIRKYIPQCMISADIIVGFPGEDENAFNETVELINGLKIFHVHSFPYSERPGTPAASMDGVVPKVERSERNLRLISSCIETKRNILDDICKGSVSVLIEKIVEGKAYGHTEQFLEACFDAYGFSVGDIVDLEKLSHDGSLLYGIPNLSEDQNERKS